MDLSERERHRLTRIERELVLDAPSLERAFDRWSTGPLRARRRRASLRSAATTVRALALPVVVLAVGVALLVVGVVHGWLALSMAAVVIVQFGPWSVACRVRARRKARAATRSDATR